MSKIKITSRQEKFLNKMFEEGYSSEDILKSHAQHLWLNDLDQLSMIDLAAVLINGYDIQDYEEGDYVVFESHGDVKVGYISFIKLTHTAIRSGGHVELVLHSDIIRLATEEEIQWAKLDREVNEWRKEDIVVLHEGRAYTVQNSKDRNDNYTLTIEEAECYYNDGLVKCFYVAKGRVVPVSK